MNKLKLYSILTVMVSLSACSSDSGGGASTGLTVVSQSGNKLDISGEWISSCYNFTTEDWKDVYIISGTSLSVYLQIYTTTDGTCSGSYTRHKTAYVTSDGASELPTTVTGEKTLTGWSSDGFETPTTAPNSQAGPALPDTPRVSTLDAKWGFSDVSGDMRFALYIDDTDSASKLVMYSSNLLWHMDAVYPNYLRADKEFIKQ